MDRKKLYVLFLLFCINFSISAFTFGGGYVVIPMMRRNFVEKRKWMTEKDLMDAAAIAQSSPGAIAVNISSLIGYRVCGVPGALISCVGATLPPLLLLAVISHYYTAFRSSHVISAILRGMEAGVAAIIIDLVLTMSGTIYRQKDWFLVFLIPFSFFLSFFMKINVLLILFFSIILSLAVSILRRWRKERFHG